MDSFLADRISAIHDLRSTVGEPPINWVEDLDNKTRQAIAVPKLKSVCFDRLFKLSYVHDEDQLFHDEEDDEGIPVQKYEKPKAEFSEEKLDLLCTTLKRLLSYEPHSRGTTVDLLNAIKEI